jgi:RimJ/RimL family protein N-acetyltransferase
MRALMNEDKQIFGIIHIKKNKVIGIINEQKNKGNPEEIELGYAIGSRYWGKGYMTEALKLAID